jgi:uncharacterized membrane protein YozB (DUF420 family)
VIRLAGTAALVAAVLAGALLTVALSRHQVCQETLIPETGPARVVYYPCTATRP